MTTARQKRERDLAEQLLRWHKAQHGMEPARVEVRICGDTVVVRTSGIWTVAERELLRQEGGRKLVTTARCEHRSLTRAEVHRVVGETVGCDVLRSFFDIDGRTGECCEVYVLEADLQRRIDSASEAQTPPSPTPLTLDNG